MASWEDFILGVPSPSTVHSAPLPLDSQSFDQVSFSDTGDMAEGGWFSGNNMTNLDTIVEDTTPRRPSIQKSPSKIPSDTFPARRNIQGYVSRSEFAKEIRGITDKLNKLQESVRDMQTRLQTVMNNHAKISSWTIEMNSALNDLARQVVEKTGVPMVEGDEWHGPEDDQLEH